MTLTHSTVHHNTANNGGGIGAVTGYLNIEATSVTNNEALVGTAVDMEVSDADVGNNSSTAISPVGLAAASISVARRLWLFRLLDRQP